MYVCGCAHINAGAQEGQSAQILGARVPGSCELPCVGAGNYMGPVHEQYVFLITGLLSVSQKFLSFFF